MKKVLVAQSCPTLWTYQAPLSMECSRQEYWQLLKIQNAVGSHALCQGIFLTQGLNLGLLHCRQMLYCLSYQGSLFVEGQRADFWILPIALSILLPQLILIYPGTGATGRSTWLSHIYVGLRA